MLDVPGPHPPPPTDPWEGRAAVPDAAGIPPTSVMPEIIVVERPRKRRWPWVLGGLGLLGILCCGAFVVATTSIREQYPSRLAAIPNDLAGLEKDNRPAVRLVASETKHRIRQQFGVDDAFAIMLTDPASDARPVLTFGATLFILDPDTEMDKLVQSAGRTISDVTEYPTGQLGGELSCANGTDDDDKPVVICAWIDHGSLGVDLCYGERSMDDCATILHRVREELIIRP